MKRILLLIAIATYCCFGQTQDSNVRKLASVPFASLGTPANGTVVHCSDCVVSPTCAGSGTGAIAQRLNGAWSCGSSSGLNTAFTTVSFSATPTFTVTASTSVQNFKITLTGNVTSSTLTTTNATLGQDIAFEVCQDATGSRTFAWPSNVQNPGIVDPTASVCSKQVFRWDGTNAVAVTSTMSDSSTPGIRTSSGLLTLPTAPDTLVGIAATQTLTNKSIDGAEIASGTVPFTRLGLSATAPVSISNSGVISTTVATAFDNSILSSSVDSSGNPNFLGTAANTVLPINGGTTPLVMYIGGLKQTLNSNVTLTLPTTVSVQQWILAKQDTSNANMVAADFVGMNTAPYYGYVAPTCPSPTPSLSSTNPAYWFDLSTGLSKLCTTNAGSYSASPAIVIGVVNVNATPAISASVEEPLRLNPYRRSELFGSGADGTLTVTTGTTTLDVAKQYTSLTVTGGTLTHSSYVSASASSTGLAIWSQNPVMILGGTVTAKGLGRVNSNAGTGAGASGATGGIGGSGGGGGGSGTTSAAGGSGGGRFGPLNLATSFNGGTAGASTPTAGGAGSNAASPTFLITNYQVDCAGASGGNAAGDGTNAGGTGGAGGGMVFIKAPAIYVASGVSVIADGNNGGNGAGGNAGGAGGGAGGCVLLNGGYVSTTGATITANGGSAGTHVGTGADGGIGGNGIVQQNKLW